MCSSQTLRKHRPYFTVYSLNSWIGCLGNKPSLITEIHLNYVKAITYILDPPTLLLPKGSVQFVCNTSSRPRVHLFCNILYEIKWKIVIFTRCIHWKWKYGKIQRSGKHCWSVLSSTNLKINNSFIKIKTKTIVKTPLCGKLWSKWASNLVTRRRGIRKNFVMKNTTVANKKVIETRTTHISLSVKNSYHENP